MASTTSRSRTKRSWRAAAVAAAATTLLFTAACGGGSDTPGAGGSATGPQSACQASEGPVTLTFWNWVQGMDKAVALWNSENPNIKVQLKNTPAGNAGTYQNMFNGLKAGTAPDVGQIEFDSLASFRLQQGLTDIGSCPGVAEAKGQFVPWTWSQVSFNEEGSVFGIPQDIGPMGLYYRKDIWDKAGLQAPTTWDEYYEQAKTLKQQNPKSYISFFSQTDPNWFTGLLWQRGARLFSTEGDAWKVTIDTPESRAVADYWQKLIDEKLVATDLQGFSPALYKSYADDDVLSWVSAAWGANTIRDNVKATSGKWAVAPMPQWEAGKNAVGNWGGSTTAVLSGSKHPAEAAKFAVWLNTDEDALKILNEEGGQFAAATSGQSLPALSQPDDYYGGQKIFEVFKTAAPGVDTNFTWGPTMTDTYRFISDGVSGALSGKSTLGDVLADSQTKTIDSLKNQGLQASGG